MTNTSVSLRTLAVLLLLQVFSLSSVDAAVCHICGDSGNQDMQFPNTVLANVGKTCGDISLEVALNTQAGTSTCKAKQNQWSRCCNGLKPAGSARPDGLPAQNIPSTQYVGPHPVCNLCRDGDYPYGISMVINFLYIGEGSCAQYYKYGKEGRIQQHMCDPVKFFAYEPCGCGEFNPYFNANHPLNQQAQQAPQSNTNSNTNSNANKPSTSSNTNSNANKPSTSTYTAKPVAPITVVNGVNQQRQPYAPDSSKTAQSLAGNGRGGSSGGGRRGLKGSASTESVAEPVLIEV